MYINYNKINLKQIRLDAGLTQAQLAEVLQLSNQTRISEYETGARNPSKQTLMLYDLIAKGKLKHNGRRKAN
jgi:transcriptional regulator with XRE-family HTH domain